MGRLVAVAALAMVLAACGGGSSGGSSGGGSGGGSLNIGVLYAFTGVNSSNGAVGIAGCEVGTTAVNDAGGVLGHKLKCVTADTKSDQADAVPAANQLLASASPVMVIGPSDEAPATVPIVAGAQIPNFATVGSPAFDHQTNPYFYRITPSDALQGKSMGYYGTSTGLNHAAAVFTNDPGAQTSVPPLRQEYQSKGQKLSADVTLAPGASSYRSEVETVLNAHPDAIFTETDPATAATFYTEMQQLGGGSLPPIYTTERGAQSDWIGAVSKALGTDTFAKTVKFIAPYVVFKGAGYDLYKTTLLGLGSKIQDVNQYVAHPYTIADYDAVQIAALAMTEANSTKGSDYNKDITDIVAPGAGKTVVHTYADGVAAIKKGEKIQYIGANGVLTFDQYHSAPSAFALFNYDPSTKQPVVAKVLPSSAF
jgi:branched-chain amino acid transport system substrate-binding protein